MLSLPGQFTFTADRPQLHCAAFLIAEPEEFITIHYDLISIDCQGGDFLKVRRPGPRPPSAARPGRGDWPGRVPSVGLRGVELVPQRQRHFPDPRRNEPRRRSRGPAASPLAVL